MAVMWCMLLIFYGINIMEVSSQGEQVLRYNIQEEVPVNTLVGNIAQSLKLNGFDLEFGFLTDDAPNKVYFDLDSSSGELRTLGRIDREVLCPGMSHCELSIDVTVRSGSGLFQIAKVIVTIDDINDHKPRFTEIEHSLYLSESTQIGAAFGLPAAEDKDVGDNGVVTYSLSPDLPQFGIRGQHPECQLVVKELLDREVSPVYDLTLRASDSAGHTASIKLLITVLDANDNAPVFEKEEYDVNVYEDASVGSTLIRLKAVDPDDGANAQVTYKFSPQTQAQFGHVLAIDSTTGDLITQEKLNYAQVNEYVLRVVAQDDGASSLSGYATVKVHVLDLNDHAPKIGINALLPVPEHSPTGSFVAHVSVMDEDGGNNGKFTCSINNPNFKLEKMYKTEFKLVTASMFDRESLAEYRVKITCRDMGNPPQESTEEITVMVDDINDNTPQFMKSMYVFNITENTALGTSIGQIQAEDRDIGANGEIVYSLTPGGVLAIDGQTGSLTVMSVLDHEVRSMIDIEVTAADKGKPKILSSSTMIRLNIIDVNDEAPQFPQSTFTLSVKENQPIGTEVGEVVAYDRDSAPFNILTYNLDAAGMEYMTINPDTGVLRTLVELDREKTAMLIFHVSAQDRAGLSSSVQVQVFVQDDNDHAPVIDVPKLPVQISAGAKIGETVYNIIASDPDMSNNAALRYSLISSSIPDLFRLHHLTGALSVAESLHSHQDENVSFKISVSDQGDPKLSTQADIYAFINSSAILYLDQSTDISPESSLIIIVLLSITAVISVILIVTIVLLIRRRRRRRRRQRAANQKAAYSCHVEPASDTSSSDSMMTSTPRKKDSEGFGDINSVDINVKYDPIPHHPVSRKVHFHSDKERSSPSRLAVSYGSQEALVGNSRAHLTAGHLKVHNGLQGRSLSPAGHPAPDADSDRGSSDSGRGASEEEGNNTSSDSIPTRPGQEPEKGRSAQICARHKPKMNTFIGDRGGINNNSGRNTINPPRYGSQSHPPPPPPGGPKRTCKVHGHMAAKQDPSYNNPYPDTQIPSNLKRNPVHPAPSHYSLDTSMDAHSDGGSTTSGEYVINLDDFHEEPRISNDVYV